MMTRVFNQGLAVRNGKYSTFLNSSNDRKIIHQEQNKVGSALRNLEYVLSDVQSGVYLWS
jgi:hypothetical protein